MSDIKALLLFSSCLLLILPASSDDVHSYNVGYHVLLYANKVGPVHNPSCNFDEVRPLNNAVDLFLEYVYFEFMTTLCQKKLDTNEVSKFKNSIMHDFYYQLYSDELPMWGYVGKSEDASWMSVLAGHRYYLFTHIQFDALYNENQIVGISAFSDPNYYVDVTDDVEVDVKFTYSVSWNATSIRFEDKMNKSSRASNFTMHQKIHWFSLINSFVVMVLSAVFLVLLFEAHQE